MLPMSFKKTGPVCRVAYYFSTKPIPDQKWRCVLFWRFAFSALVLVPYLALRGTIFGVCFVACWLNAKRPVTRSGRHPLRRLFPRIEPYPRWRWTVDGERVTALFVTKTLIGLALLGMLIWGFWVGSHYLKDVLGASTEAQTESGGPSWALPILGIAFLLLALCAARRRIMASEPARLLGGWLRDLRNHVCEEVPLVD